MLVSTKGRYALRAMIDLAEHSQEGFLPLKEVAQRQGISEKYLESILKTLVAAKLVKGMRGKGGGYQLTRLPNEYSVAEVLRATEGSLAPIEGLDEAHNLPRVSDHKLLDMWQGLDARINEYLEGISLAELADTSDAGDFYVI